MSVYSGFATRQQESKYNECLQYTLQILTKRLTSFYMTEECNEAKFQASLRTVCNKMQKLQENKHMLPHYSHILSIFLNGVSQTIGVLSQLSRIRGEQQLHSGCKKMNGNHNAYFNSFEQIVQCEDQKDNLKYQNHVSHSTFKMQQRPFGKRTKTLTPDKRQKCMSFTPSNFHIKKDHQLFQENMKSLLQDYSKNRNRPKNQGVLQKREEIKLKAEVNLKITKPLSPRQFLRQTIQGKQFNQKHGHRTKIRHQRIV